MRRKIQIGLLACGASLGVPQTALAATTLVNGTPLTSINGATGSNIYYTLQVEAGASNLNFNTTGGSGDVDLYVKFGSEPTSSSYDCRPYEWGNDEVCDIANIQPGTYHVMMQGYSAYSGVTLSASFDAAPGSIPNTAPVADNQSISTSEDTAATITLSGSDADGDSLTYAVESNPSNGTLSGTVPNLTYTPKANYNGNDSFTFSVDDGNDTSGVSVVSINVNAVEDAPTADDQSLSLLEDGALAIQLSGNDDDGDTLSFAITSNPNNGSLTGTAPNLSYTPVANYYGNDNFNFTVADGNGGSATGTVNLNINAVNDAPTANNQSLTTMEDTALALVLDGDDLDGDTLSFSVTANPSNGSLTGTAPNLSYTPTAGFAGSDDFSFEALDGKGGSASATVGIIIEPAPTTTWRPDITVMGYNIMMLPSIAGDWDQNQRADHLPGALRTLATLPDVIGYSEVLDDYSYAVISDMEEYPYTTPVVGQVCSNGGWDSISGPCSNTIGIVRGGMMISSMHPIEEQHALIFTATTAGSADAFANKGAVYAKIDIEGYKYHIVDTHLQATHDGGDDDEHLVRTDQLKEITSWIDSLNIPANEPVIMTGDFNVPFSHTTQIDDMVVAGKAKLNFPNDDGFGSYPYDNLMSKAFVFYYDDDVCYDDTLDYVMDRADHLQPVSTPEVDVIALKSPTSFYWDYLDGNWTECGGAKVTRDGYTTDISDHYPVVATYEYPDAPDVAPEPETDPAVAVKKSDSASLLELLPLNLDYAYFQDAQDFPFEPQATEFSWVNSWWLSDAAFLAYTDQAFAQQQTAAAGLTEFAYFDVNETQCYVANNDEFAIMSCRGTESFSLADWATDFDYTLVPAQNGGNIHQGFKVALDDVWEPLSAHVAKLKAEGKSLWFTGHSLGGALAQSAADRICLSTASCEVDGVYTYGSPGTGDQAYADDFHAPHYRTVYYNDPVPRLSGSLFGYTHNPGEIIYFDYDGNYTGQQTYQDPVGLEVTYHSPFYYSIYTWNNYVDSLSSGGSTGGGSGTCDAASLCIDPTLADVIIDNANGSANYYSESGSGWADKSGTGYVAENDNYRYSTDASAQGQWTFNVAQTGSYQILFRSPGGFSWSHGYGSDTTVYKVKEGSTELAATNSGSVDLYNNAYNYGDVEIATLTLTQGSDYTVTVSGAYSSYYSYGIAADAIKLVYIP